MLIKFGARNFCSFKEGVEVSFELPSNSKLKSVSDYSHAICVKGANGSGKTNVLKILSFLRTFCCDSFNKKPDDDIYIDSFFSNDQVIEVYIEFEIDKVKYRYELALTRKEIKYEKLSKKIRRSVLVIERLNNKIEKCVEYYKSVNQIKLRSNASFISTANQYEINELSVIYNFFSFISSNVHALGFYDYQPDLSYVSKLYSYNEVLFDFAKRVIKKCDLGIDDIVINKRIDANGKEIYYPIFYYQ
ncbi:ATP-binding protein, partial [bacterium]|nr:ATP-binding protein [bacterium]